MIISFDLESDDEINLTITKNDKKFKIENSASGYYEILYLLIKLHKEKDKIVILDEPTLHLHPIKQKHFWRFISENNNGQLIAITHSPFLVNLSLFENDNKLINIQNGKWGVSKIYPQSATPLEQLNLKNYNFKSSIFFSLCNIFVGRRE